MCDVENLTHPQLTPSLPEGFPLHAQNSYPKSFVFPSFLGSDLHIPMLGTGVLLIKCLHADPPHTETAAGLMGSLGLD